MPQPIRRKLLLLHKLLANAIGLATAACRLWWFAGTSASLAIFEGRSPRLDIAGTLVVGTRFKSRARTARSFLSTGPEGTLRLGDRVFINQGVCIHAERSVTIGDRVSIGDNTRIYDTGFHGVRPGQAVKIAPVIIEDDVWLAAGVTVLAGVTIGRGSVVGTGAVVTRSVPAGSLVAGSAATTISQFDVPADFRRA
ncbi:acyltransferase [Plantibacter flavus]|uniref:acyltransferase n=1 Tax=Plantibacter flavus TaxID=150123 RepID=UPI003F1613B5